MEIHLVLLEYTRQKPEKTMKKAVYLTLIIICTFSSLSLQAQQDIYIDTNLPGKKGQKFASGLVSNDNRHEFGSVFSPDGKEFFFAYVERGKNTILAMYYEDGKWSQPDTVLTDDVYGFNDPFLSTDGDRLYYISNYQAESGSTRSDIDIWYSERQADGRSWGPPVNAGPNINSEKNEYYMSFNQNGSMYFSTNAYTERSGDFDIYKSDFENGSFQPAQKLGPGVNTGAYEADVFVAPDESYLVFASTRRSGLGMGDLYISFNENGKWTKAKNLGSAINTSSHELCPFVTYDGKYLFYTSNGDIYWVSTEVFKSFR